MTDKKPKTPMSARTRRVVVQDICDTMRPLRDVHAAVKALEEMEAAGYPSGVGTSSLGGATHCDPTGEAATSAAKRGVRPDEMLGRIESIDERLFQVRDLLQQIAIDVRWATTTTEAPGAEGCWFCSRVEHANNHQQTYTRIPRDPTNPASLTAAVCSWHYEFRQRYHVNPATRIVMWHLDSLGQRVPYALIREYHPEQFAEYHQQRRVHA